MLAVAPATQTPAALAAPAASRVPAAAAAESSTSPVQVSITEIAPHAPKPGDTLRLTGSLVNTGTTTYGTVMVRLRVSRTPLNNRTEIRMVAAGAAQLRDGLAVDGTEKQVATDLAPTGRVTWSVSTSMDGLALPGNGVYVVGVEARGSAGPGTGSAALDRIGLRKTFLPWLPRPAYFAPTRLAWLWPLAGRPVRDAGDAFANQRVVTELAKATRAGGRLDTLVSAPGSVPVTWVVDPDLLESVSSLSTKHRVRAGPRIRLIAADLGVKGWLNALHGVLAGKPVSALPYADPDVVALQHNHQAARIGHAVTRGAAAAATLLGRPVEANLAWPVDGLADAAALTTLAGAGVSSVVLDSTVIASPSGLTYTPTGRTRIDTPAGPLDVLVADAGLTTALTGDLRDRATATLAGQRFLADTALITLERPNVARTVLVAPPRRWSPPAGWLTNLLNESRRAPWLQTVDLDTLRRAPVSRELQHASVTYPVQATARELPSGYIADVRRVAREAGRVTSVLTRPEAVTERYDAALLRAQSSAWRGDPRGAAAYLKATRESILRDRSKVRVIGRDLVTLSSKTGTIPVTVTNELSQQVTVRLSLTPKVASRLRIDAPKPLRVGAGRKTTIRVPAVAYANGLTQVDVRLLTPDGAAYGPSVNLRVNATNYGTVGLVVVVGSGLLLFVAAGVRNIGRVRRARAGSRGAAVDSSAGGPEPRRADEKVQA